MSKLTEFRDLMASQIKFVIDSAQAGGSITKETFMDLWERVKITAIQEAVGLDVDGATKKAEVVAALTLFIDSVPLPGWWKLIRPVVKYVLLAFVGGSIDFFYSVIVKPTLAKAVQNDVQLPKSS